MAFNSSVSSISWGGTTIAAVGSFSVSLNRPAMDITPIGAIFSSYVAGTQSVTGTLDIFYDQGSAAHTTLETAINSQGVAANVIMTMTSGQTYTGDAFVTSFEITAQAGSVVRASVGLQFTGAITIA